MKEELKNAVKSAPGQKEAGSDDIFAEMLKINEEVILSLFLAISAKLGNFVNSPPCGTRH